MWNHSLRWPPEKAPTRFPHDHSRHAPTHASQANRASCRPPIRINHRCESFSVKRIAVQLRDPSAPASLIIDHMLPLSGGRYLAIAGCPKYMGSERCRDVALVELSGDAVMALQGTVRPARLGPDNHARVRCRLDDYLPEVCPGSWEEVGVLPILWLECDYSGGRPRPDQEVSHMQAALLVHGRWVSAFEEAVLRAELPEPAAASRPMRPRLLPKSMSAGD